MRLLGLDFFSFFFMNEGQRQLRMHRAPRLGLEVTAGVGGH